MLLIEKINSFIFLKIGPKTVFLGKKRCLQFFFGKILSIIAPKQRFFVTGIIELTPKTLQNYGFVNIGLTPPPLFPQSYHSGGFDDKRVVLGRRNKNWNCR